jgi:molybdenum cofactor synthesis domain-containing protein
MRAALLTVSSTRMAGDDKSGDVLAERLAAAQIDLAAREIVVDEKTAIAEAITRLSALADLVLTTGGTGITQDDVTPEATLDVIDREVPGIAEALRAESMAHTPMAMLSRGIAGVRGKTLIVNFPGSPQACEQCFAVIDPILKHAHSQLNR